MTNLATIGSNTQGKTMEKRSLRHLIYPNRDFDWIRLVIIGAVDRRLARRYKCINNSKANFILNNSQDPLYLKKNLANLHIPGLSDYFYCVL